MVVVMATLSSTTTPTVKTVVAISSTSAGTYTTVAQMASNMPGATISCGPVLIPTGWWLKVTNTLTGTSAAAPLSGMSWALT
jgi:hypothetical protein